MNVYFIVRLNNDQLVKSIAVFENIYEMQSYKNTILCWNTFDNNINLYLPIISKSFTCNSLKWKLWSPCIIISKVRGRLCCLRFGCGDHAESIRSPYPSPSPDTPESSVAEP